MMEGIKVEETRLNMNFVIGMIATAVIVAVGYLLGHHWLWWQVLLVFLVSYPWKINDNIWSLWGGISSEGSVYSSSGFYQKAKLDTISIFSVIGYLNAGRDADQVFGGISYLDAGRDAGQGFGVIGCIKANNKISLGIGFYPYITANKYDLWPTAIVVYKK